MADTIKIGNLDISAFKVGSGDCSIYLGDTLLYPQSPTPPTPTYIWRTYNEGDTVPSATIYGVKLENGASGEGSIEFGTEHNGIVFLYESGEWSAVEVETGDEIDISSYYDEGTYKYTILFSDLGYSNGLPIFYPQEGETLETDVDLYEQA